MPRLYVSTNGCEEAGVSSRYVDHYLERHGATLCSDPSDADLLAFFACGLTREKERESLAMIRKLRELKRPEAELVVWGCLSRINPEALSEVAVDATIGPRDGALFERYAQAPVERFDETTANSLARREVLGLYDDLPSHRILPLKLWRFLIRLWHRRILGERDVEDPIFYVRVATGCENFCTFCSERIAWGKNLSRSEDTVLEEIRCGLRQGYRRFLLLAGDLGVYGSDIGSSLPKLLRRIVAIEGDGAFKLILAQLNPRYLREMFENLEEVFASGKVEMLGCPVQSGSDRVLERMGRRYGAAEWREYMIRMNSLFPEVRLKPQFMVGFPGETEEDFRATMALLDPPLFLHDIKIFKFATRPTIPAARLPDHVPERVKRSRYRRLSRRYAFLYARHAIRRRLKSPRSSAS